MGGAGRMRRGPHNDTLTAGRRPVKQAVGPRRSRCRGCRLVGSDRTDAVFIADRLGTDAAACLISAVPLKQLSLEVGEIGRPIAIDVNVLTHERLELVDLGVEIVEQVQGDGFDRHG